MYSFVEHIQNYMIFYGMSAKSWVLKNNDSKWPYSNKSCHFIDKLSRKYNISSIYELWHRHWSDIIIHEVCQWFLLHIRRIQTLPDSECLDFYFLSLIILWFLLILRQFVPCHQIKTILYILNVIWSLLVLWHPTICRDSGCCQKKIKIKYWYRISYCVAKLWHFY